MCTYFYQQPHCFATQLCYCTSLSAMYENCSGLLFHSLAPLIAMSCPEHTISNTCSHPLPPRFFPPLLPRYFLSLGCGGLNADVSFRVEHSVCCSQNAQNTFPHGLLSTAKKEVSLTKIESSPGPWIYTNI